MLNPKIWDITWLKHKLHVWCVNILTKNIGQDSLTFKNWDIKFGLITWNTDTQTHTRITQKEMWLHSNVSASHITENCHYKTGRILLYRDLYWLLGDSGAKMSQYRRCPPNEISKFCTE